MYDSQLGEDGRDDVEAMVAEMEGSMFDLANMVTNFIILITIWLTQQNDTGNLQIQCYSHVFAILEFFDLIMQAHDQINCKHMGGGCTYSW